MSINYIIFIIIVDFINGEILFCRPKPGSLTEYRGMKANIEVFQGMAMIYFNVYLIKL